MRSFVKMKPSRNGQITLSFIDIGKSCLSREFFTSLICLLMLFAKIKISRKFLNLQYISYCTFGFNRQDLVWVVPLPGHCLCYFCYAPNFEKVERAYCFGIARSFKLGRFIENNE